MNVVKHNIIRKEKNMGVIYSEEVNDKSYYLIYEKKEGKFFVNVNGKIIAEFEKEDEAINYIREQ